MKVRFEVRSIKSQWKPPFKKEITDEVFDVLEGESFDRIIGNGNDEAVFKLLNIRNDSAIIEYSKLFTLKAGNPSNRTLILIKDSPVEMTYLWGEDGITKKITFKGFISVQEQPKETPNDDLTKIEPNSEEITNDNPIE